MNTFCNGMYSHTDVKAKKSQHTWTIRKFDIAYEVVKKFQSRTFSLQTPNTTWRIILNVHDTETSFFQHTVSVHLAVVSGNMPDYSARAEISILRDRRPATYEKCISIDQGSIMEGSIFDFPSHIKIPNLLDRSRALLMEHGDLTILLEVVFAADQVSQPERVEIPPSCILNNFGDLLRDGTFSDVTISVNGLDFKAHKNILAARSPVFAAMFEHDMLESKNNRVVMEGVDTKVFAEFLNYIYTDKIDRIDEMAADLLAIADQYGLDRLKFMCEKALMKTISDRNAVETLLLADCYGASEVKAKTIEFMNANAEKLVDTEGFRNLTILHPSLIADIFRARKPGGVTVHHRV